MREHRKSKGNKKTFAGKYHCYRLIYYEIFNNPMDAIRREKFIKNLLREKKFELIRTKNPNLNVYNIW